MPDLSAYAKSGRWQEYNSTLTWAIKIIALITIPITFYSLITGREIIQLVYKTRRFDENSVALTLRAFTFHIAGLFFIAANRIISPAFYAQGNTKLPTLAGIIGFAVNITLAALLCSKWSGGGIAFALSAASLVNTIALFVFLKRLQSIDVASAVKATILYSLKMILFSIAASVPAWLAHKFFVAKCAGLGRVLGNGIPLALTALVFAAVGALLLLVTRDQAAMQILRRKRDLR